MITRRKPSKCWTAGQQASLVGTLLLGFCQSSLAQIVPDNTLGSESSTVTPDNIRGTDSGSSAVAEGEILVNAAQSLNLSGLSFDGRLASSLFSQTTGTGNGADIAVSARHSSAPQWEARFKPQLSLNPVV